MPDGVCETESCSSAQADVELTAAFLLQLSEGWN